jgi:dTMP kinase
VSVSDGRFLVLEGPDGSGKSTQAGNLVDWLAGRGREVVHLRDPGTTRVGERIRAILLDPAHEEIDATTEMMLFMAARAQLVAEKLRPALDAGKIVVCERWLPSTACYQGYAGGLDPERIFEIGEVAAGGLVPDLCLVLDVDPGTGLERAGGEPDLMESRSLAFHRAVREGYLRIAKEGLMNSVLVPAGPVSEVEAAIRERVEHVL